MDKVRIIRIAIFILLLLSLIIEKVFSVKYVYIIVFFVSWGLTKLYEKKTGIVVYPKYKKEKFNFVTFMYVFIVVVLVIYILSFFIVQN